MFGAAIAAVGVMDMLKFHTVHVRNAHTHTHTHPHISQASIERPLSDSHVCVCGDGDVCSIGHFWTRDYGSSDDADGFQYLLRISPVHNVQSYKPYPAVMLTTGDHDDRVVPLHSYKYVAALQHAWSGKPQQTQPLLIRIETKAGQPITLPPPHCAYSQQVDRSMVAHSLVVLCVVLQATVQECLWQNEWLSRRMSTLSSAGRVE